MIHRRTLTVRVALAASVLSVTLLAASVPLAQVAFASDPVAFKERKAAFDDVARKHDEPGARARRDAVYDLAQFLDQKACRKLLEKTLTKEKSFRVRAAIAEVLGSCGDAETIKKLIATLNKSVGKQDDPRGDAIALGLGLGYTPAAQADAVALELVAALRKSKGDVRISLIEGLGLLGASTATEALRSLPPSSGLERFERNVALGKCGGKDAVTDLLRELEQPDPDAQLGAVIGLAETESDEATLRLLKALEASDPRVIEVAARHLGDMKAESAAEALVAAFEGSPLRTRNELRLALADIVGSDFGLTAADWKPWIDAKKSGKVPPKKSATVKFPEFFGMSVPSDRVIVLLDLSGSMDWKGRITSAQTGIAKYLQSLPDNSQFSVYGVHRDVSRFADGPSAGTELEKAAAWVRKQLTARGIDLQRALTAALAENPQADTIVYATDSGPWSRFKTVSSDESTAETMQIFRRVNRTKRMRLFVAFTVPGGRDENSEKDEGEYLDRIDLLTRMAETTGGEFKLVE